MNAVHPPPVAPRQYNAGLVSLAAELASLPTPALAEQVALLGDVPPPLAALLWHRLVLGAAELARRSREGKAA